MADLKTQFGFTDSLFAAINEVKSSGTSLAGADAQIKRAKANLDAAELRARQEKERDKVRKKKESLRTEEAEEVEEQSHQSKTTMKHVSNPNAAEKKAAKDIKPGIKGVKDRLDMLKAAKDRGALKEEDVEEELKGGQVKLDKNKNGKLDAEDFKKVRKEDVEIEEGTGNLKPGWMLKKDPELAKKVKEKQDLAKKRQASYGDKSAGKSVAESIMDKIKAVKRGMDAKAKAADHFDKAGDPSNPDKSKDLKRAVKYHNLVNKEETEIEEGIVEAVETSKVPVGSRPKGIGWSLHRAGKQHNEPHDTYKRTTKQVGSSSSKNEETEIDEAKFDPLKHIPKENQNKAIKTAAKDVKRGSYADRAALLKAGGVKKEEVEVEEEVKDEYGRKVDKYLKKKYGSDDSKKKEPQGAEAAEKRRKERLDKNGRMDEESIDEAPKYDNKYTIYHKDYSSAVQHAAVNAEKQGYEIDHDDWDRVVAMGPKKPSAGKTNILSVSLKKAGKESKKKLHMQVYNMDNKGYELNTYVEEVQLDELNKDTVYSYAKKSEKDQDDQEKKMSTAVKANDPKKANDAGRKFLNRLRGSERAEKRLNQEAATGYDEFTSGGKPLEKKFNKAFKAMGIKSDVKIKTVGNISVNEAAKPTKKFKDMKKSKVAGTKSEEGMSKKGEPLSGKKEPIEVNPEMHSKQK